MFKKLDTGSSSQLKSSVTRHLKSKCESLYPALTPFLDALIPKKAQLFKSNHQIDVTLYSLDDKVVLFQYEDILFPCLTWLHTYPDIMRKVQVDRGAIPFVLKGADIMCPGLTSKGGNLPEELEANTPVAIFCEGKEHAIAIGLLKMSTKDIKSINKGIAIQNLHYLRDALYDTLF